MPNVELVHASAEIAQVSKSSWPLLYSAQIGLRNTTQLCVLWIPAFAGMTVIKFFANHSVWSIVENLMIGNEME